MCVPNVRVILSQIIFQVVIGAVTGTRLAYDNLCQLNLDPESGRVCDFVYPTIGFGIFFSLLLTIGTVSGDRVLLWGLGTAFDD